MAEDAAPFTVGEMPRRSHVVSDMLVARSAGRLNAVLAK